MRWVRLVPLMMMASGLLEPAAAYPADYDFGDEEVCGTGEVVWALLIFPFLVVPMVVLWHRLLDNLFRGVAIGKLTTESPLGKRQEQPAYILTGLALCAATVLTTVPVHATSVVSFGLPAFPLIWAAIFSPWFLLRHWSPGRRGRLCPTRALLVGLCAFGLAGWIYLASPWL